MKNRSIRGLEFQDDQFLRPKQETNCLCSRIFCRVLTYIKMEITGVVALANAIHVLFDRTS